MGISWGRGGGGEQKKKWEGWGSKELPQPLPLLLFSHSLAVSFPPRAFGNERLRRLKKLGKMDKDEV